MLNVFVQRVPDETGKGKFLRRLAEASLPIGVKYSEKPKGCDILLDVGWWHGEVKTMPRVLRMDGAEDYNFKLMKDSAATSDAMIWQNNFCAKTLKETYGIEAKREFVVCNGANPKDYISEVNPNSFSGRTVLISGKFSKIVSDKNKKPVYIERHDKRLGIMITLAKQIVSKYHDIRFLVAGHTTLQFESHKGIEFLGNIDDKRLCKLIAGCDVMFNLSKRDWCPNSVVECLVAGKPIIYSSDGGGIVELVGDSGFMVNDLDAEAIVTYIKECKPVYRPDLDIKEIAEQYKNVFEKVLNDK